MSSRWPQDHAGAEALQTLEEKAKERMQVHQESKAGSASHPRLVAGLRTACLTSGSNRSLRSLGRAKARPLTKRYAYSESWHPVTNGVVYEKESGTVKRAEDL